MVRLETKFVPSLFRMTNTPLNSAPETCKLKFVLAVTRLTKVPPLSWFAPITTLKLPSGNPPVKIKGRVKCNDEGAALPTVHTGAPPGNATTTTMLANARAANAETINIIMMMEFFMSARKTNVFNWLVSESREIHILVSYAGISGRIFGTRAKCIFLHMSIPSRPTL